MVRRKLNWSNFNMKMRQIKGSNCFNGVNLLADRETHNKNIHVNERHHSRGIFQSIDLGNLGNITSHKGFGVYLFVTIVE